MRNLMTVASVRVVLGFWFIVSLVFFGNISAVKAEETPTVEGEWEMVSTNAQGWQNEVGMKMKISRKGDGYEVTSTTSQTIYSGSGTRIVHTFLEDLGGEPGERHGAGSNIPEEVSRQVAGQKVPINISYELSADGNYLTRTQDAKWLYWDWEDQQGRRIYRFTNYEIKPGFYRTTFKRVAGSALAENRADHAYSADCGKVDPNRTTPITTDLCPGNLVAMTYFCGGGTGCPYVCCPKGLPYLNHCDCKCYATADFECHSYSKAQEQPRQ
jgi:hypothetical protein